MERRSEVNAEDADRADNRSLSPAELMAESNPAESLGQIGSKGDWLKRLGKVGDC